MRAPSDKTRIRCAQLFLPRLREGSPQLVKFGVLSRALEFEPSLLRDAVAVTVEHLVDREPSRGRARRTTVLHGRERFKGRG
jgi:hypothetical protein